MFIDPMNQFLISCPDVLRVSPAVYEASDAAWWLDKGSLSIRYPNPPAMLLRAAQAFSQGVDRGQYDKLERSRKKTSV